VPGKGNFGVEFSGPATLNSITFTEAVDASRMLPSNFRIYTDRNTYTDVPVPVNTQGTPLTVTFASPISAANSYAEVVVTSMYSTPGSDSNWPLTSFSFDGTVSGTDLPNLNAGNPSGFITNYGAGSSVSIANLTDGTISNGSSSTPSLYWTRDATNPDEVSISYNDGPKTIGSIGLGFFADNPNRDMPKTVTVSDSHAISEVITLDGIPAQYMRYTLHHPFVDTDLLTLTFPTATGTGSDSSNFYLNGDANYGLTEFQAFAPVPEPTSIALLGGCGLLLAARRRKRSA